MLSQFTCTIMCERTDMVEVECIVIRYRVTCCKTDSPVLFQNFLFFAVVKLAFQSDCHDPSMIFLRGRGSQTRAGDCGGNPRGRSCILLRVLQLSQSTTSQCFPFTSLPRQVEY